jgi:hypothetical protein
MLNIWLLQCLLCTRFSGGRHVEKHRQTKEREASIEYLHDDDSLLALRMPCSFSQISDNRTGI